MTSAPLQASALQSWSAVAWCRGSRGGRRDERGPYIFTRNCLRPS